MEVRDACPQSFDVTIEWLSDAEVMTDTQWTIEATLEPADPALPLWEGAPTEGFVGIGSYEGSAAMFCPPDDDLVEGTGAIGLHGIIAPDGGSWAPDLAGEPALIVIVGFFPLPATGTEPRPGANVSGVGPLAGGPLTLTQESEEDFFHCGEPVVATYTTTVTPGGTPP